MELELKHILPYLLHGVEYDFERRELSTGNWNHKREIINCLLTMATSFGCYDVRNFKPILQLPSDLTKEEINELGFSGLHTLMLSIKCKDLTLNTLEFFWKNHIDYQYLIEKGLAIHSKSLK